MSSAGGGLVVEWVERGLVLHTSAVFVRVRKHCCSAPCKAPRTREPQTYHPGCWRGAWGLAMCLLLRSGLAGFQQHTHGRRIYFSPSANL